MQDIITRYAPSPTGIPHVGNIRTALFNYLFAKNQNGKFILRIEDTDQKRSTKEHIEHIKKSLNLLKISFDDYYEQSTRLKIYQDHLEILKKKSAVYQDDDAFRFKVPQNNQKISWNDVVHSKVEFPTKVIEDFIVMKSDGYPTYHFASVVDDRLMQITHVMRGDEWISSTPKHLLLYEAFGWQPPQFCHLPAILALDRKKLSKREGAKSVMDYVKEGYLPEALINFLVLLGWAPGDNREIFTFDELIKDFSLERLNKNSPVFNIEKLNWFNGQWIRKLKDDDLANKIAENLKFDPKKVKEYLPLVKDRMSTIADFKSLTSGFFKTPKPAKIQDLSISSSAISSLVNRYENIIPWSAGTISGATISVMETEKIAKPQMYRSIGIATLGSTVTPPLMESLEKLGKDKTIERLTSAIKTKNKT